MSGSWKVAYADFMTAMMAFFLLMWILNMAPQETKEGLAGYFALDANLLSNIAPSSPMANNTVIQRVDKLDAREYKANEAEKSDRAIAQTIKQFLLADAIPMNASGVTSDNAGVLLHVTGDLLFKPDSVEFTDAGNKVLDEVIGVMRKYKVYLVVRGHTAKGETGAPNYPSKWELSSARATAAIRYIVEEGKIDPTLVRSVAYADTRPLVPETDPESAVKNRRVEFYFHRPEVMTNIVGY
ncbi:OmpA/MotB domain protein [uncultured delta proteobacterium]|uniref:OmpA/MotB domain protein n=1 Tax=uncultured delta proteobacterium TaxID=34034 RepID=A0A212J065_9DELT|nr:OmpA/MotB domain protein [uncultured delta proteobacterium]